MPAKNRRQKSRRNRRSRERQKPRGCARVWQIYLRLKADNFILHPMCTFRKVSGKSESRECGRYIYASRLTTSFCTFWKVSAMKGERNHRVWQIYRACRTKPIISAFLKSLLSLSFLTCFERSLYFSFIHRTRKL